MTIKSEIDIIVIGGGTSGCAAAIAAGREGAKVLLIEEEGYLGGAATTTYVTPMMKTMLPDGTNLGGPLYIEVLERLNAEGFAQTNFDGNPGWFAPEMMKFVLDDMVEESHVQVLYHTTIINSNVNENRIVSIRGLNKAGIQDYKAKFYIDATGEATIAAYSGAEFELGYKGMTQAMSHRFVMANIDIEQFATWLQKIDINKEVSPVYRTENGDILLTTAYTSEDKGWALRKIFMDAIVNNILKPQDAEYFQIFTVPGQKGFVYFNCPRIYSKKPLSPLNPIDISYAQTMGRKQIRRIARFCKIYFPGFEKAVISNVAANIGIRDSRRIKGKYILTADDILSGKKFDNVVARCNYPIDIHSNIAGEGGLKHISPDDYYEIPLECLQIKEIDNLFVVGKAISAEFQAQASLRIMPTCWSIGESAGRIAATELLSQ